MDLSTPLYKWNPRGCYYYPRDYCEDMKKLGTTLGPSPPNPGPTWKQVEEPVRKLIREQDLSSECISTDDPRLQGNIVACRIFWCRMLRVPELTRDSWRRSDSAGMCPFLGATRRTFLGGTIRRKEGPTAGASTDWAVSARRIRGPSWADHLDGLRVGGQVIPIGL